MAVTKRPAMRDLKENPAWSEEDLGIAIPDSLHAVSVCLPNWKAVVDYEEGRDRVVRKMRAGYPRFFRHPAVERLFEVAKKELAGDGHSVMLFPSRVSAQRAQRFVERRAEVAIRIASFHGLQALIVPEKAVQTAVDYWRFSGEVVSSRQAMDILDGNPVPSGRSKILRAKIGKIVGVEKDQIFVFASGMAACTSVLRSLPGLRMGKKTLQIEFPYVDCLKVQEMFGNGVVFLNQGKGESLDEALHRVRQGEFAGVFLEVPSNPLLRTVNLPMIAEACRLSGTPLIVDDSTACPGNVEVLRYADVVTTSLTKWISGAGDVMAGMACVREDSPFSADFSVSLAGEVSECAPLYPGDSLALLSNLRHSEPLWQAANESALALVGLLQSHAAVDEVWHPSITCRVEYDALRKPTGGYGGLLSFTLKSPKKTAKFYDALEFSKGPSFGTPFTLVCPYTLLAHYQELPWAEGCGVPSHLLRVSVGSEGSQKICDTFLKALDDL
ncbi:MAG: PLP-dependent transferase [Akkermansiaceae bacterium]